MGNGLHTVWNGQQAEDVWRIQPPCISKQDYEGMQKPKSAIRIDII